MPAYNLLVDIGNTFLKWGVFLASSTGSARDNRLEFGHVLLEEIPALAAQFTRMPTPAQVVISNVAGTRVRATMIRVLEVWPEAPQPHWVIPQERQCGVVNRYRNPAQLGSDRWAALIGARALLDSKPGLVVVCGTATTIDFMSASGEFRGGVILPGMGLMLRSLHQHTAALPDADGEYVETPTQTVDAIASGCQHAQAGAIERLYNLHASKERGLVCLISGGASRALAPRLTIPFKLHDNLALEGLYRISQTLEG
ncbi:MAG: type III pantothenate kinase [Betaproteobacteria bacterium]|nr:MAG: type III pantothenate kinase [Betaproteobacteria bacterium]